MSVAVPSSSSRPGSLIPPAAASAPRPGRRLLIWSITSALAGFLFGFDTVVISGAEQTIQSLWGLSAGLHGVVMGSALYGTVLDRDLQDVANELWHDGAEAIAVNGERLTATSTIRTAGSTILVDFRPISSPYQVSAIGPRDLDRRFTDSRTGQRFHAYVSAYGMQVSVSREDDLTLPAAADPQLHYAQPVPSASPSPSPVPSSPGGR